MRTLVACAMLLAACRSERPTPRVVESPVATHAPVRATGIALSRDEVMIEELRRLRESGAGTAEVEPLAIAVDYNACRVLDGDALTTCLDGIEVRASRLAASSTLPEPAREQMRQLVRWLRFRLHGEALP